jgi:hypothetical protein
MAKRQPYNWQDHPRWLNFLVGLDQLGNTILPLLPWPLTWPGVGNPDRTISYTLGKLKVVHGGVIPWRWPVARGLAAILDWLDPNHCVTAYKNET